MTNYNERLDEVLETVIAEAFIFGNLALGKGVDIKLPDNNHELPPKEKAKQAITSLMRELVAEAKPGKYSSGEYILNVDGIGEVDGYEGHNQAIDQFEQNLLKALEEV